MEPIPTDPRDVIALSFAGNVCYTKVTRPDLSGELPDGVVSIDPERGVWVAKPSSDPAERNQELAIGQARHFDHGSRWGIIGIYDSSNLDHLNRLVTDAKKATSDQGRLDED